MDTSSTRNICAAPLGRLSVAGASAGLVGRLEGTIGDHDASETSRRKRWIVQLAFVRLLIPCWPLCRGPIKGCK